MSDYFESGFCVNTPSWHRKETLIDEANRPTTWEEARPLAGLDWDPISEPVFVLDGVDDEGKPTYREVEGFYHVARSDSHDTLTINHDTTALIDNREMGEIIEAVLEQEHVKFETAGSVEQGRAVWALALLDEPVTIKGDSSLTLPYLAVTNRHDGLGGCNLRATAIRIVCANTFRAAELEGGRTGATFSFRHTKNWRDRMEEARQAISGARQEMRDWVKLAEELMGVKVTPKQRELFVRTFIPSPPDGIISDRVANNIEESRMALRAIFASQTTAEINDNAYGLLQGAVEYLDHVRKARTWETGVRRTLLKQEPLKAKAKKLALKVAKADTSDARTGLTPVVFN